MKARRAAIYLRVSTTDQNTDNQEHELWQIAERAGWEVFQERVRAGLERARRDGKRLGRPPLTPKIRERIQEALKAPGRPGVRKIAEQFGVNASTVQAISSGL
jgi:DNA invertase Pin-like site-specific DNA recombinase